MSFKQSLIRFSPLLFMLAMSFIIFLPYLFRPLWYDESLTIMEFVMLKNPFLVYKHYTIPNNHIIFNEFLLFFLAFFSNFGKINEAVFRLPSLFFALSSIAFIMIFWAKKIGKICVALVCLSLIFSTGFQIYGTSVRGYMLSFLLTLFALELALRFIEHARFSYIILSLFFLTSIFSVGTIPSNLIVFAGIVLLIFSETDMELIKKRWQRLFLLALMPPLSLLLFYLPIFPRLLKALSLREGWEHEFLASLHFYAAFFIPFACLSGLALCGIILRNSQIRMPGQRLKFFAGNLILLLPFLCFVCKTPSPFPRALFPYWPLMIFILAKFAKNAIDYVQHSHKEQARPVIMTVFLFFLICGLLANFARKDFSANFAKGGQDDFFLPHFLDQNFRPAAVVRKMIELENEPGARFFIDSGTDYPSILFYGKFMGAKTDSWLFDRPIKKLETLGAPGEIFVLAGGEAVFENLAKRFSTGKYELIMDSGHYKIYRLTILK